MTKPKKQRQAPNSEHEFVLVLVGEELTDALAERVFDAGCGDALLSSRAGAVFLDFIREAPTMTHAVESAVAALAAIEIAVRAVEPDDLVNQADIAERASITRSYVSLLCQGHRGPGDFPQPERHISSDRPMWSWAEVSAWLAREGIISEEKARAAQHIYDLQRAYS